MQGDADVEREIGRHVLVRLTSANGQDRGRIHGRIRRRVVGGISICPKFSRGVTLVCRRGITHWDVGVGGHF